MNYNASGVQVFEDFFFNLSSEMRFIALFIKITHSGEHKWGDIFCIKRDWKKIDTNALHEGRIGNKRIYHYKNVYDMQKVYTFSKGNMRSHIWNMAVLWLHT